MPSYRSPEQARALARELAERVTNLERRVSDQARAPQLASSSIEDGALHEYDAEGNLSTIIGRQYDGDHGVVTVRSPAPPTPSRPTVTGGLESATIRWDGLFSGPDGATDETIVAPTTFTRVEVHLSTDPTLAALTADTLKGTIETPRGGEIVVSPLVGGVPVYARLVARNAAGKASGASFVGSGTPQAVEVAPVLEEIDAAEIRITNAAEMLLGLTPDDGTVGVAINDAAASPVTDERLAEGSLTVWPFQEQTVPQGALQPGAVGAGDLADFAVAVKNIKSNRHMLY